MRMPAADRRQIHSGKQGGLYIFDGGIGQILGNDIHSRGVCGASGCLTVRAGNVLSAIQIRNGSGPQIIGNKIRDGRHGGIYLHEGSTANIAGNDISWYVRHRALRALMRGYCRNQLAGIWVCDSSDPIICDNDIHHGLQVGLYVYDGGLGHIEGNRFRGHRFAEIQIRSGGNPTIEYNTIVAGQNTGIYVYEGGCGSIMHNFIAGNERGGVYIKSDGAPIVSHNTIACSGDAFCVFASAGAKGTVSNNAFECDESQAIFKSPTASTRFELNVVAAEFSQAHSSQEVLPQPSR